MDAYRLFGTAYMNPICWSRLAIIPLALWLSRRFSDRMGRYSVHPVAHAGPRRVQPERTPPGSSRHSPKFEDENWANMITSSSWPGPAGRESDSGAANARKGIPRGPTPIMLERRRNRLRQIPENKRPGIVPMVVQNGNV